PLPASSINLTLRSHQVQARPAVLAYRYTEVSNRLTASSVYVHGFRAQGIPLAVFLASVEPHSGHSGHTAGKACIRQSPAHKASLSPSSSPPSTLTAATMATPPVKPVFVRALAAASVDPAMATPAAPGRHAVRARATALAPATAPVPAGNGGLSVAKAMSRARDNGMTAFIPYITAGDPDLATTAEALRLLDACGADVIEVGMPFSNPYADGAVIQASAARALAAGATSDTVMAMLKEVTPELSCPVVIFSYFNPIERRGTGSFTAAAREAGVRGLIVPDLPYTEASDLSIEAKKNEIELVWSS
uniref:tryptophan synthase n=1 Tax=Aegilops tauschii subsp. strangulata TaxID=200361 RepID=A0A453M2V5_AEGTS